MSQFRSRKLGPEDIQGDKVQIMRVKLSPYLKGREVRITVPPQASKKIYTSLVYHGWLIEGLADNASLQLPPGPMTDRMGPYTIVLSKGGRQVQLFTGLDPALPAECLERLPGKGLIPCPPELAHLCFSTTKYELAQ